MNFISLLMWINKKEEKCTKFAIRPLGKVKISVERESEKSLLRVDFVYMTWGNFSNFIQQMLKINNEIVWKIKIHN